MPRKKGVPNKRSQWLLKKLEEGGFHVANEFIELYNAQKKILGGLIDKLLKMLFLKEGVVYLILQQKEEEEI